MRVFSSLLPSVPLSCGLRYRLRLHSCLRKVFYPFELSSGGVPQGYVLGPIESPKAQHRSFEGIEVEGMERELSDHSREKVYRLTLKLCDLRWRNDERDVKH